jgi:hypothetical protein
MRSLIVGSKCRFSDYAWRLPNKAPTVWCLASEADPAAVGPTLTSEKLLERHKIKVSDKHAVFRVNKAGGTRGEGITQFGRALLDLNIESICANSPAAKGRVERANGTLQDRLVKELRLAGIGSRCTSQAHQGGACPDRRRHLQLAGV